VYPYLSVLAFLPFHFFGDNSQWQQQQTRRSGVVPKSDAQNRYGTSDQKTGPASRFIRQTWSENATGDLCYRPPDRRIPSLCPKAVFFQVILSNTFIRPLVKFL